MRITLVRIGSKYRPACPDDIIAAKNDWQAFLDDPEKVMFYHHAIEVETINVPSGAGVIFRIGDDDRPAGTEDLEDARKEYEAAKKEKRPMFVSHAVDAEVIQL